MVLTTRSVSSLRRTASSIVPVELLNYLLMNNGISLWPCSYNPILFLCFLLGVQIQSPLAALQIIRSCHTCWWPSLRRSMPCRTRLSPTVTSRLWPRCVTWQTENWWSISAGPSTSRVGPRDCCHDHTISYTLDKEEHTVCCGGKRFFVFLSQHYTFSYTTAIYQWVRFLLI